jgi:transposase
MITIGVDFHKRTSSYSVLNEQGQLIQRCKMENTREQIREFIQDIPGPKQLAMESTRSWGLYHDCVADLVDDFYLGHPKKMKAITESETKNDQKDSLMIARLTHSGFLPKSHVSSLNTRQLRGLLRFRHFLVRDRKSIRNQVQTLLDRNLWPAERPKAFKNPFCKKGLRWLKELPLHERERFILDQCLESHEQLTQKINDIQDFIAAQTVDLPGLKYLCSVPGFRFSQVNAYIVLTEIDDIQRFHKARGLAYYSGLIPREYSSGDKHHTGRLVKDANMFLRTAFIESVFAAVRSDKGLREYYKTVKQRSGSGDAIIATARKLSGFVYHVLKEQRNYSTEKPLPSAAALDAYTVPSRG